MEVGTKSKDGCDPERTGNSTAVQTLSLQRDFKLVDSHPTPDQPIKLEELKKGIFIEFNNPVNRDTAMYIASHYFRENARYQWTANGWIQYEKGDRKLIWHMPPPLFAAERPFSSDDLEYQRFDITVGVGADEANVRDIYGNVMPKITIPVWISPDPSE